MAEQQRKAPGRPAAERYFVQYLGLSAAGGSKDEILQEEINERAKVSWKLISIAEEPGGDGLLLVWDTSGFYSG
jgi:hypothetical protein